jgi:hypothetical protein
MSIGKRAQPEATKGAGQPFWLPFFRHQFDVPVLTVQRDLHPSQLCAILSATKFETDRDEIPLLNFC